MVSKAVSRQKTTHNLEEVFPNILHILTAFNTQIYLSSFVIVKFPESFLSVLTGLAIISHYDV